MISETSLAVMRKIARRARLPSPPPGMSSGRAWRQTLPVSAEEAVGLDVTVRGFEEAVAARDEVLASWSAEDLHLLLRSSDGVHGLAIIGAPLLTAIVECMTRGKVMKSPPPTTRAPSDIDAALAGPILNRWITDHERLVEESGLEARDAGFRAAERLDDARAASLALEDGDYLSEVITLDISDGTRLGSFALHYPASRPLSEAGQAVPPDPVLMSALDGVTPEVRAVLLRRPIALTDVAELTVGATIELPRSQLSRVRIEGADGRFVHWARLGRSGGRRAVRLAWDAPEEPRPEWSGAEDVGGGWDLHDAAPDLSPALGGLPALSGMDHGAEPSGLPELPELGELPDLSALPPIDLS